ncbi:hypothetical protein MATL_G00170930 [Megalops atlanticus]|uniref:Exocyst complex component Sec3 PIP2-binding N-terminal domain-containing protein n=1 Tax=Megalops atlanticus TaxID=7932 RepID=A0A9D3PR01_MEGAT|nr:hypothetical protein MATL_G00170930 [Megalops atlanticus]
MFNKSFAVDCCDYVQFRLVVYIDFIYKLSTVHNLLGFILLKTSVEGLLLLRLCKERQKQESMAVFSLRSTLQREIFSPQQERLLAASIVWKVSRKRKSTILCAAVSSESWGQVALVTVKGVKGHYKLSSRWSASDLSLVDGKDTDKETAEFHLHLDKVYRWVSGSPAEKRAFVTCLWKINQRYLQDRVKFVNISPDILEEVLPRQQGRVSAEEQGVQEEEEEEDRGFQELTAREAADVQRLMEESELAVSDATAFSQALRASLANMDQENLQALMEAERQGGLLLDLLEEALKEVEHIEEVLSHHDRLLQSVQRQMKQLHLCSSWLQHTEHNHSQLRSELCHLVDGLTLSKEHMRALTEGDLEDEEQVKACIAAVKALSKCRSTQLTAGQRRLQGVAEQLIRFENVRQIFEQRLALHINNAVVLQGLAKGGQREGETSLRPAKFHKHLLKYAPLMDWLRESSPQVFQQLVKVYAENIGKLYDRQMKDFFDAARLQLSVAKEMKKAGTGLGSQESVAGALSSGSVPFCSEGRASRVAQQVLSQLECVCATEQEFLTAFFGLDSRPSIVEFPIGRRGSAVDQVQSYVNPRQKKRPHSWCRVSAGSGPPDPSTGAELDCVWAVLGAVEPRLCALLSLCEKTQPLCCLTVLKTTDQCLSRHRGKPDASFLCSVLQCAIQHSQRSLHNYTEVLYKEMESQRVLKKNRVGVLPFVSRLEEFVNGGQMVLGGSEECWGLGKVYAQLFNAAFQALDSLVGQNARCSPLVVKLLNFHWLQRFLAGVQLPELKAVQAEARERTALHVQQYIDTHLGRPLGSLSDFLDGVQSCLAHGVREEEVCFQLAYSKQELRRLTALHAGRDVQRTLEVLHKMLCRDLGDDPVLLQEVWRALQQNFVAQYRRFESLTTRCYPEAGASLDFSEQDLKEFFSAVSQGTKA